jgi:transposase
MSDFEGYGLRPKTLALPYGGLSIVARATGLSPNTIKKGIEEIEELESKEFDKDRIRKEGGRRKSILNINPQIYVALDSLVEPTPRVDPESPLRWTCKSTRNLSKELKSQGHNIGHSSVGKILQEMGFSLKGNRKVIEGMQHHLRNEHFIFINNRVRSMNKSKNPVISVDTKKKEILENFANVGKECNPKGKPIKVNVHDFPLPALERANSYGVLDLFNNIGFVNNETNHYTSAFAIASIKAWWYECGYELYNGCSELLITADGEGSNSYRTKLWKWELQLLSEL